MTEDKVEKKIKYLHELIVRFLELKAQQEIIRGKLLNSYGIDVTITDPVEVKPLTGDSFRLLLSGVENEIKMNGRIKI